MSIRKPVAIVITAALAWFSPGLVCYEALAMVPRVSIKTPVPGVRVGVLGAAQNGSFRLFPPESGQGTSPSFLSSLVLPQAAMIQPANSQDLLSGQISGLIGEGGDSKAVLEQLDRLLGIQSPEKQMKAAQVGTEVLLRSLAFGVNNRLRRESGTELARILGEENLTAIASIASLLNPRARRLLSEIIERRFGSNTPRQLVAAVEQLEALFDNSKRTGNAVMTSWNHAPGERVAVVDAENPFIDVDDARSVVRLRKPGRIEGDNTGPVSPDRKGRARRPPGREAAAAPPISIEELRTRAARRTPQLDEPFDFLRSIFSFFRGPEVSDFVWVGEMLSAAQLKNLHRFSKKIGKPLKKGSPIRIIQKNEMKSAVDTEIGRQAVYENGPFETSIVEKSQIDSKPREVLKIRLHLFDGRVVETPMEVLGNSKSVNFAKAEFDLFHLLRGNAGMIEAVEFAHSHPSYVVSVGDEDGSRLRANAISIGDMNALSDFSTRWPIGKRIIIKAVVPNGFYYEKIINGRR